MTHSMLRGAFAFFLVSAVALLAPSAEAALFDFAAVADNETPTWTFVTGTGEAGYGTFIMTVDGLTVTATATKNGSGASVYLDSEDDHRPAGMGVCGTLSRSAQNCASWASNCRSVTNHDC